jgi:phage replication O-like protein O
MPQTERFIRFPTACLEALLGEPLSGAQWRIITWVIRRTWGWNRQSTPFSWYRIARDLQLDRGGVARAGRRLMMHGILFQEGCQLRLEPDCARWKASLLAQENRYRLADAP